ncbi:PIN-like domain-containing protein [Streptomyces sp. NBC_00341]|uniref:PIN-like domain-containing protein n=1 Tax=unclassified Streptomyces TaxID=2593676 RepID=UPI00352FA9E5
MGTSALLRFYAQTLSAHRRALDALQGVQPPLRISHQAGLEFSQNRHHVVTERQKAPQEGRRIDPSE